MNTDRNLGRHVPEYASPTLDVWAADHPDAIASMRLHVSELAGDADDEELLLTALGLT